MILGGNLGKFPASGFLIFQLFFGRIFEIFRKNLNGERVASIDTGTLHLLWEPTVSINEQSNWSTSGLRLYLRSRMKSVGSHRREFKEKTDLQS